MTDAACGCESSSENKTECDCEMQGECLCDGNCACKASVCKDHVASF